MTDLSEVLETGAPTRSSERAAYWLGYLQGAADALDTTVLELLDAAGIDVESTLAD